MDVLTLFANTTVRDIGAVAIVALVVLMILTGRLVPKVTHDRELEAAEKRVTDAVARGDEWKQSAEETQAVNAEIRAQNSSLIKANEIVEALIRSAGPTLQQGVSDVA